MKIVTIKRGDTEKWTGTVSHAGTDPPLQGATAVDLFVRSTAGAANIIDGEAVDTFDSAGNWEYTPSAAEVDTPGNYFAYLRATYAGGETRRFPSDGFAQLKIGENFE